MQISFTKAIVLLICLIVVKERIMTKLLLQILLVQLRYPFETPSKKIMQIKQKSYPLRRNTI